jgi:hypothetical protein
MLLEIGSSDIALRPSIYYVSPTLINKTTE